MNGYELGDRHHGSSATPSIVIYNESVARTMKRCSGAKLVIADPPWLYDNAGCRGNAADQYETDATAWISSLIQAAYDSAADDAYLLLWITWPKLADWLGGRAVLDVGKWYLLSGGTWGKLGGLGVGFHVRGDCEPLLLLRKGNPHPHQKNLSNLFLEPRTEHSEKPVKITRRVIEALTEPGSLVFSMFVGLGNDAVAAKLAGRNFIGAELDKARWKVACERIRLPTIVGRDEQVTLF